jgi:hypothetical protein
MGAATIGGLDVGPPDIGVADTGWPDTGTPDTGRPDTGVGCGLVQTGGRGGCIGTPEVDTGHRTAGTYRSCIETLNVVG